MIRCSLRTLFFIGCTAIFGLASAFPLAAQDSGKKDLTIERIFSPPPLSGRLAQGLEWLPDGNRISFIENTGDGPELWRMDAATGEKKVVLDAAALKQLTQPEKQSAIQSTGLGRVQAENYKWSPDGESILFIGSSDMVLYDLAANTPKPLVTGDDDIEDPKFSPDGKWVSFVRDSNLWVVSTSGGDARALTTGGSEEVLKGQLDWVYPEELDCQTAYWWSPDSSKIAYYEMDERPVTRYPIMDMSSPTGAMDYTRYPQAGEANPIVHVGVVPVGGGDTKWMDSGADTNVYLPRVEWLPDSKTVAIERLNRAQKQLDLLFANAQSGSSKAVLTDTDQYWINVGEAPYFFTDGKSFLWSSERTGYRHYYLYDISGKLIKPVTSGDWEIGGSAGFGPQATNPHAVDEKNGYLYFSSNKDEIPGLQIFRVSLKDRAVEQLSKGAGTHDPSFSPNGSAYVDIFSDANTPPCEDLYRADGTRVAAIVDNNLGELVDYRLSPVQFLTVPAKDGTPLYAEMIKPPDFNPSKRYPVLIDVYGGPDVQNVVNGWAGGIYLLDEMLAEKGYIVFSLDNRGSSGRGHVFETPIYHHLGRIELQDQLAGVAYLKSQPYVDASRIGIWGWSYGGYMTLNALFNAPGVFKMGVSVAPVTDWHLYDSIYTERYMGTPQENPEGYADSSPVNQAAGLADPLLLIHATGDDNVHFANTAEVLNALIESGKYPTKLIIFPGRGHGISDRPARLLLFEQLTSFIFNNL